MLLRCFNCGQHLFQIEVTDKGETKLSCGYCRCIKDYHVEMDEIPKWMQDNNEMKRDMLIKKCEKLEGDIIEKR